MILIKAIEGADGNDFKRVYVSVDFYMKDYSKIMVIALNRIIQIYNGDGWVTLTEAGRESFMTIGISNVRQVDIDTGYDLGLAIEATSIKDLPVGGDANYYRIINTGEIYKYTNNWVLVTAIGERDYFYNLSASSFGLGDLGDPMLQSLETAVEQYVIANYAQTALNALQEIQ